MPINEKITNANHSAGINNVNDRSPVYGKKFNKLLDELTDGTSTDLKVSTISADTISETTSGSGVTIDGVLIKDGGATATAQVIIADGSVGTPGIATTTTGHGLYEVSATQLGASVAGALATVLDTSGIATDSVRARVELGTVNTGVTAVTYGDGRNFTTVLTVSQVDALTIADNSALADGYLLYTFPAGEILVTAASMSMEMTAASTEAQSDTPDVGLGTLLASDTQATLDLDDAACENILTGQAAADANGTPTLKTVGDQVLVIATADNHTVYFNVADTWADDTGGDLTADISGTVTLKWTLM